MKNVKLFLRGIAVLVLVIVGLVYQAANEPTSAPGAVDDADRIVAAYEAQRSDLWVVSGGQVERTLSDDEKGSRHQRFIVRLTNGHSILIAHNIDLAPRVPLSNGDHVQFRGEFEWNDRGGVVHWTHHDPRGRKEGGWIAHDGERYE